MSNKQISKLLAKLLFVSTGIFSFNCFTSGAEKSKSTYQIFEEFCKDFVPDQSKSFLGKKHRSGNNKGKKQKSIENPNDLNDYWKLSMYIVSW